MAKGPCSSIFAYLVHLLQIPLSRTVDHFFKACCVFLISYSQPLFLIYYTMIDLERFKTLSWLNFEKYVIVTLLLHGNARGDCFEVCTAVQYKNKVTQ